MPPLPSVDQPLWAVLAHQAQVRPDAVAVHFEGRTFTYARLARRVARASARLVHDWGVAAGDRVAYLGFNHVDALTLLFALSRAGAVWVPLNMRLAPAEWQGILADCAPVCVVAGPGWEAQTQALGEQLQRPVHPLDRLISTPVPGEAPAQGQLDDPVLLVYTSGTTGLPKAAVHTQRNLMQNMALAVVAQNISAMDVIASVLPVFHVGGLCIQTLPALYAGAAVVLEARFDAERFWVLLREYQPTLSLHVPATLHALVKHPAWTQAPLGSLRAIWAGSSVLSPDLLAPFHARGIPVCNVYGATETGPVSVVLGPEDAMAFAGSSGWPVPGVEVRLAALPGEGPEIGELWVRGPNVVKRYWPDRPAVDAEGWFHTGDLARRSPRGDYTVIGRVKDMVISGGENIYPAEVERVLSQHPDVLECVALGLPDAQWGEVLTAVCVPRTGAHLDADQLDAWMGHHLARYKCPRHYVWVEGLPKTALGKVQRQVLRERLPTQSLQTPARQRRKAS